MQRGSVTLSHVTFRRMQIPLKLTKNGAVTCEYDVLFSAGPLLSAVEAHLPFT